MEIRRFTPDDRDTVVAVVEVCNAAQKVDAPSDYPTTVDEYTLMLRHGWDGEVPETYAASEDSRHLGVIAVHTSEWDNRHLAWVEVLVHPDARGAGRGSELLAFAENRARELGRTSIGMNSWDADETKGFAAKHGLPRKGIGVKRRQTLAKLDRTEIEQLYDEARTAASSYELLRLAGRTPGDLLEAVAEMTAAINDAPTDDLDIEDEVFPVERVAAYEAAQEARNRRLYRVVARHRDTGALAGHTVVVVEAERPQIGDQHDTSVVGAHRGHRLGLLLKTEMLRWLWETEPALATIDTWNMESNGPMIGVNERLGYEILGRELEFQRSI
ncbi:MAG TPA: GNAT family N-acetyltransferase [Nocardioidaceae bacterium]|nr:GNAT family N-acetyltransferase [Nocardioidaceae bacterium]